MARTVDPKTRRTMDRLADIMADGCPSVIEAARRMRLTQSWADQRWQRIRRQLGRQAK